MKKGEASKRWDPQSAVIKAKWSFCDTESEGKGEMYDGLYPVSVRSIDLLAQHWWTAATESKKPNSN